MIHNFIISIFPAWFWHPLGQCVGSHTEYIRCRSYNFWSGIGSDIGEITVATSVIAGIVTFWIKHNCHIHRCPRLSWHPDKEGHPICKVHHEDHPAMSWFRSDKNHPRHSRNN